jgi:glutathione S-transferase
MSETVTLYTNPMSRGRTVHWLLEELGAPYEMNVLSFDKGEHKSPEYLRVNPMGKVPAIVHRGVVVTEAAAICVYLADEFSAAGLAPAIHDPRRGTYLRWFFFGVACIEPAVVDKVFGREPVRRGAIGYGTYEDTMSTLANALTPGPFILGDAFSAVDVYVGSQVHFGITMESIEPTPIFQRYAARCAARPALQRVMQGG